MLFFFVLFCSCTLLSSILFFRLLVLLLRPLYTVMPFGFEALRYFCVWKLTRWLCLEYVYLSLLFSVCVVYSILCFSLVCILDFILCKTCSQFEASNACIGIDVFSLSLIHTLSLLPFIMLGICRSLFGCWCYVHVIIILHYFRFRFSLL